MREKQENEKLDILKTKEAETFFNSKEGESLSKLLEFYEYSKSFSSLNEVLDKLAERRNQSKEHSRVSFLKHMKEIFEEYKKHENKINS
ncbi:hypothetical protein JIY74_26250 [Vibrio harveyi]|nr:hypothetical protein [Vibrio harveyi]